VQFNVIWIWEVSGIVDSESLLESIVSFLDDWLEVTDVYVHREDNGPHVLCVLLVGRGLDQCGDVLFQLLHVGLAGQLMDDDIGLGAHVDRGAALAVQIVQTLETLFAAGAVRVELARLGL